MGGSTELRKVKRSWSSEFWFRTNWLFFGTLAAVLLAFIPIIGWAAAAGIVVVMLWKAFGPREALYEGECPACTKVMDIDPKQDDVLPCLVCGSVFKVGDGRLTLVDLNR